MDPLINFYFLNKKPENCNIICNSKHNCKLGILGAGNNPTDSPASNPILYLGDRTEMWPGSAIVLVNIPETPIYINSDGVVVDLAVVKESISFGLPTCDCCPLLIMDDKGKIALAHISLKTLSLHETVTSNGINNSQKIPILHQIFSIMKPKNCNVWMGPCIRQCCYEFSANDALLLKSQTEVHYPEIEYIDEFHGFHPHCDNKVYVDFPNIIVAAMVSMGVNPQSIVMEYCSCTVCGVVPRTGKPWHSYRRSGNTDNHNWAVLEITTF